MLDDGDYGPWQDDQALPDVSHLNAMLDAQQGNEQLRQIRDAEALPKGDEARFARGMSRVAEGSLTPGPMYREPALSYGCGTVDDFGRCSARYHQATCMQANHHAAAAGGGEASEAWVGTLLENQAVSDALGEETEELLADPGPGPSHQALMRELGLS
jgi:hypothetical protein